MPTRPATPGRLLLHCARGRSRLLDECGVLLSRLVQLRERLSMRAIATHFRHGSTRGKLEMEDELGRQSVGKDGLSEAREEWRTAGTAIDEVGFRREAINILSSMPRGTDSLAVHAGARSFAKSELADQRHVMVLREHQANPHVVPGR